MKEILHFASFKGVQSLFSCCLPLRNLIPGFQQLGGTSEVDEEVYTQVFVRFENQTNVPISVYWFNHLAEEKWYFDLNPECTLSQHSYSENVWLVKDKQSGKVLMRVKIDDRPRQLCAVPQVNLYCDSKEVVRTEVDSGIPLCYVRKVDCKLGIPVVGFQQVSMEALNAAKDIVENMLQDCPKAIVDELLRHNCKVAVIAKDQTTTDIVEHRYLRGSIVSDGRDWDKEVRGLGATKEIPTCSVGEENLLRASYPEDKYYDESILVHEMAHSVMEVAFDEKLSRKLEDIYERTKDKYTPGIYMRSDESEYWALGSEAWFHAIKNTSHNDGIITRDMLRERDPELATMMQEIYGNGSWRYDFSPQKGSETTF